jgi:CubicO group peptidase (beta-lactamase class C family)
MELIFDDPGTENSTYEYLLAKSSVSLIPNGMAKMKRLKFLAISMIMPIFLIGCLVDTTELQQTQSPHPVGPTTSTAITTLIDSTSTITPTTPPTRTPFLTTAPYDKVPEQIGDGWQTASLVDVGINPVMINKMFSSIDPGNKRGIRYSQPKDSSLFQDIHSILIVKDGCLVFEEYFYHYYQGNRHTLASVTKSITSLLVGLAIDQGYLSGVDEKILDYFPEYLPLQQSDERVESITIEDLLTMRHGWECDEWDPASITYRMKDFDLKHPDLIEATLELPIETDPGTHFSYCTPSTVVLGGVLQKAIGMKIAKYARENLFNPLDIKTATWISAAGGWTQTGAGMEMLPRDMAKIGLLVLQNGNWNGKQIISENWIQLSTQEHVSLEPDQPSWGRGYGYLWRLGDVRIIGTPVQSIYGIGGWQQVIAIFPDLDMVVVINGGDYEEHLGQPFEILEGFILPAALGY